MRTPVYDSGRTKHNLKRSLSNRCDKDGYCLLCSGCNVDTENGIEAFPLFGIRNMHISLCVLMPWRTAPFESPLSVGVAGLPTPQALRLVKEVSTYFNTQLVYMNLFLEELWMFLSWNTLQTRLCSGHTTTVGLVESRSK